MLANQDRNTMHLELLNAHNCFATIYGSSFKNHLQNVTVAFNKYSYLVIDMCSLPKRCSASAMLQVQCCKCNVASAMLQVQCCKCNVACAMLQVRCSKCNVASAVHMNQHLSILSMSKEETCSEAF